MHSFAVLVLVATAVATASAGAIYGGAVGSYGGYGHGIAAAPVVAAAPVAKSSAYVSIQHNAPVVAKAAIAAPVYAKAAVAAPVLTKATIAAPVAIGHGYGAGYGAGYGHY